MNWTTGVACGSSEMQKRVANEDESYWLLCLIPVVIVFLGSWIFYFYWHVTTKWAYYNTYRQRFLWETRFEHICQKQTSYSKKSLFISWDRFTPNQKIKRKLISSGILVLYRLSCFLLVSIAWSFDLERDGIDFFFFLTNWTFTALWIYFLVGTVVSIRGVLSIVFRLHATESCACRFLLGMKSVTSEDLISDATLDWFSGLFVWLTEMVSFQVFFVDILYWIIIYQGQDVPLQAYLYHGPINAIVIIIDIIAAPAPMCIANVATTTFCVLCYAIYVFILYWSGYGCYPYQVVRQHLHIFL